MSISVLGPLELRTEGGETVGTPGGRQARLLAALAMRSQAAAPVEELVHMVWDDDELPQNGVGALHTRMSRLRPVLSQAGLALTRVGPGYVLETDGGLDVHRFEQFVSDGRQLLESGDLSGAIARFDAALELWRGPPYQNVADLEWARPEVARLEELRASAVELRFEALLSKGRHTEVVAPLEQAIAVAPYRDRLRAQMILALYRSGRQAEALRAYEDYRRELADVLGLMPGPELQELERRVLAQDSTLVPVTHRTRHLRGYELETVIGEGSFAMVWRGRQPVLDRDVAIKQMHAKLANSPGFIRHFEAEAQMVAALEHPHIVPLYDYWREPDAAFLVMRYLRGGTLESRLVAHPLDEVELRRLVEQVGAALQLAHSRGVIHRDVKPANVLLDEDANFYLGDFGIAFGPGDGEDDVAARSTGSPGYASPEQPRRQDLDSRSDIYAFGVTLFEAATGELPFGDETTHAGLVSRQLNDTIPAVSSIRPEVPAWLDGVVARATAKNPADRFASVAQMMSAVPTPVMEPGGPADARAVTIVGGEVRNPFKGLRAFHEADTADFRGRERLVTRLLDVLRQPGAAGRFLAVVGPSGSGKSSVVRAGLAPALRAGAIAGSDQWFITTMMPGSQPFEELEAALMRVAPAPPGPLVEMMADNRRGIGRATKHVLPDETSELVVVIDQFEELFTLVDDAGTRRRFIEGMLGAVREPRSRLRVVVTIRADFWDRPLSHPGLAAMLETGAITVAPLDPDELERAIVDPVAAQGMAYEPGLVARIAADVNDQPAALPLLQYALTQLFDAHVSGLLTSASYDAIGGIAGALAQRAEETYCALSAERQTAARRVFERLVTLGEGAEDTRRRVTLVELGEDEAAAACTTPSARRGCWPSTAIPRPAHRPSRSPTRP